MRVTGISALVMPEAPASSVMAVVLRNQARYCRALAANNPDPRIRAMLTRLAKRLSAQACAALSRSRRGVVLSTPQEVTPPAVAAPPA
jgi:hypothetical protein